MGPIKMTKITEQRNKTWRGITDQNGHNPFFYNAYDTEGRIAASKQGIVTVPAELAPRERLVDRTDSLAKDFVPKVVPLTDKEHPQITPKAFIKVEGREPGDALMVNKQEWRMDVGRGETGKELKK